MRMNCDVETVGSEVWMLSDMNSCLLKFNVEDVLSAAKRGISIELEEYGGSNIK